MRSITPSDSSDLADSGGQVALSAMSSQPFLFGTLPSANSATTNIDGGPRGNQDPVGYGVLVERDDGTLVELKGLLAHATNHITEYHGLLAALEWVAK
jgi:hypothetical protein